MNTCCWHIEDNGDPVQICGEPATHYRHVTETYYCAAHAERMTRWHADLSPIVKPARCPACYGQGIQHKKASGRFGGKPTRYTIQCPDCKGTGTTP